MASHSSEVDTTVKKTDNSSLIHYFIEARNGLTSHPLVARIQLLWVHHWVLWYSWALQYMLCLNPAQICSFSLIMIFYDIIWFINWSLFSHLYKHLNPFKFSTKWVSNMNAKPAKRRLEKIKLATKSTLTTALCLKNPSHKQKKGSYKLKNKLMWSRQNTLNKMLFMSRPNRPSSQNKKKKYHGFTCQLRKDCSEDWSKGKHLKLFKRLKLSTTKT